MVGLTGNVAAAGAASAGTSTLISGVWEMADGTREADAGEILGLAGEVVLSAGIGAAAGFVSDKAGTMLAKGLGLTGRGSWSQVYKMADTKIHNGTWTLNSLKFNTWKKCIGYEFTAGLPGIAVSQLENATKNGFVNMISSENNYGNEEVS